MNVEKRKRAPKTDWKKIPKKVTKSDKVATWLGSIERLEKLTDK